MATATATGLKVFVGGSPVFADVSFKLEAGERMTLAGRNGAGKTTLLRVLAGSWCPSRAGWRSARASRVALHDQRPPRKDTGASLGDYVFSGARRGDRGGGRAGTAGVGEMGRGRGPRADGRLRRRPAAARAGRRLPLARGRCWRCCTGWGSPTPRRSVRLRPSPGGELTRASLARALAGGPGSAAARRAHQPPRHPHPGMAGGPSLRAGGGDRPGRPRPLVPGVGRHLGARAGGRPRPLLRRALARLAHRAGRPRARPRAHDRAPAGRDRADGALRRALPLQGDQGQAGPVAAEADREDQARRPPSPIPATAATCASPSRHRSAPGGSWSS